MMTSKQVADALGVDKSTVSRWVATKRLEVKMQAPGPKGQQWFDEADVDAIRKTLDKRTVAG